MYLRDGLKMVNMSTLIQFKACLACTMTYMVTGIVALVCSHFPNRYFLCRYLGWGIVCCNKGMVGDDWRTFLFCTEKGYASIDD